MENLSQKSYSGNGFAGKTVYDDSAKFGVPILSPRAEDYTEIFEGFRFSRGSSIPMLDLPAVDDEDADLFFDVRSSNFGYSEVFGGFNDLEFAVSYQELFKQSNGVDDSTPEAWTPAQSEYLTDESDSSVCSEKNQCSSIRDLRCSFDGTNQFSVLYHKANPNGKEDILIGTSHVTQLDTVPGYSFNGNEIPPAQKIEDENLHLNLDLGADFNVGVAEGKGFVITTPQHLTSDFDEQEYESELSPSAGYDKASSPQKAFISVPDISLRTKPSHWPFSSGPPPVFSDRIGNSTKLNTSINNAFERAESDCSPPCFDVEIDASSSTAASAAAMKDVAEKARAQLRSVKESTERKKECLQSCTKLQSENYIKNKEEKTSEFERFNSLKNERVQGICEREGKATENYAAECRKKVSNTNVAQKVREWQEKKKKTRVTPGFAESKKVLYDRDKFQNGENVAEDQLKENEVVFEQKLKGSNDRMECETRIKEAHERKESGREIKESFASGQCERGFKEDVGRVRNWRKLKKELELGTKENQGIYASMEGQKASDGVCILGETETPQATHNKIQGKLQTQNACLLEENERLGTKPKCSKREMEAVEGENRPIEESFNSSGMDAKEMLALEDREKEERLKKERDLENDRVGKIKEERGREREREKDRMAVNKATCEASERASAEARDRAGRAAVDSASGGVRQKALAEARERLEKASAEARERLNAEKVRGRDFEKATAKKVSAEARERVERSRFEGESAQRCKARLERHRRTAERAAKALAEKNMRDVLVHKELAERKRLAEALDADIKRWSSGKEENLRALLSTLQYILGLDSGWQPIPLTEVITAVAVKKAYRKAMLCVHPDKLQQRVASLQQKYICEKVFDLLKEAWNKFNSEER